MALNRELLKKAQPRLLGTTFPKRYGVVATDLDADSLRQFAGRSSFRPRSARRPTDDPAIYMFGPEAQRQKYLPGLVAASWPGVLGVNPRRLRRSPAPRHGP